MWAKQQEQRQRGPKSDIPAPQGKAGGGLFIDMPCLQEFLVKTDSNLFPFFLETQNFLLGIVELGVHGDCMCGQGRVAPFI